MVIGEEQNTRKMGTISSSALAYVSWDNQQLTVLQISVRLFEQFNRDKDPAKSVYNALQSRWVSNLTLGTPLDTHGSKWRGLPIAPPYLVH